MTDTIEYTRDGHLISEHATPLPEILDILVVGGGPAGTAVAFRAKEMGLTALVIDFDDLMKRIRDYSKDKAIIPSFGGGDKMEFPRGGPLISLLEFESMDKDKMCESWKGFYKQHNISAQVGVELISLARTDTDIWRAILWNHNIKEEQTYLAKHVVLTVGRGVPRRIDIPGNCEGLCYRLTDPKAFVGVSTCVIGGGTSAAEAVIAISRAKAEQKDDTPLFWSYRGVKMPRVSKALADEFFDAYLGNGNIRYYPKSDPVAVVTASDQKEYLAIRTDSQLSSDSDPSRYYLEVRKEFCLACIGEDIPEQFFESIGIHLAPASGSHRKRMVVTKQLETNLPNIFLAGDILSQSYFQTDDFEADPATFRRVEHRGNIKAALNDGVLVAEVIQRKIAGNKSPDTASALKQPLVTAETFTEKSTTPPTLETQPEQKEMSPGHGMTVLRRLLPGGVEAEEYDIKDNGVTTIGRHDCDITLPDDTLLAPFHASLTRNHRGTILRDESEGGGVFLKLVHGKTVTLEFGTILRTGRQFLLFEKKSDTPFLVHYDHTGQERHRCRLTRRFTVLGRQADLSLDSNDISLSRRHLAINGELDHIQVKDLNSANGTFMRIVDSCPILQGTEFKVGGQLFRFVEGSKNETNSPAATSVENPENSVSQNPGSVLTRNGNGNPAQQPNLAPRIEKIPVQVLGVEQALYARRGQTIYDILEQNNLDIVAECHAGICGSDPIRVTAGHDNLSPVQDEECETLSDLCHQEAGECRLACLARILGPIELEIIKD